MSRRFCVAGLAVAIVLVLALPVFAQTTSRQMIHMEGRAYDQASPPNPLSGSYGMTFRLYDVSTNGTALFTEAHTSVSFNNGFYEAKLGEQTTGGIPASVFANNDLYMEIQIGTETLSPRVRLASEAFAFNADMLDGQHASDFAPATGSSSYFQVQGSFPGTQQTGNANIDGTFAASLFKLGTDGSASAPALAFTGDTNLGLFRAAADTLAFTTNGVETMRIQADGTLTLGATADQAAALAATVTANNSYAGLFQNTAAELWGSAWGVKGVASGVNMTNKYGVYGEASGNTGNKYGVYGIVTGGTGVSYGVYGQGNTYGVYGKGLTAVVGESTAGSYGYGVYGSHSGGQGYAGYFVNSGGAGFSGPYWGVCGTCTGAAGGSSTKYSVYGSCTGTAGTNCGVYGTASGATTNWAGYFDAGNVYVAGKLAVATTSPTAAVDVNGSTGYNQLRLRTTFTPSSSSDASGNVGDISWDGDYIYVKTSSGWKRSALSTW
jgi:hypothetical protein